MMTTPDNMPILLRIELDDLRFHWDEAYKIDYDPGANPDEPWRAERHDDGQVFRRESPAGLRDAMRNSYNVRPIPRVRHGDDRG